MKLDKTIFDALEESGVVIEPKYRGSIESKLNQIMGYRPKVGFFGKTGAGKSSLCNAIFGQGICEISDVGACTREPKEVLMATGNSQGIALLDVPGVGESSERDAEYEELYKNILPELDIVLWVLKGDDRAFSSDEAFFKNLVRPYIERGRPFFFVLNQVDKIEPYREWDEKTHQPGPKQAQNIEAKKSYVAQAFDVPLAKVIAVSASEKFGLVPLVDSVVHALPQDKQFIVLNKVSEENRSEKSIKTASTGFWNTVKDIVVEVVPSVVGALVKNSWPATIARSFFSLIKFW